MTPGEEARAVAYEQMAWWITEGIAAGEAYEAITGRRRLRATWKHVEYQLMKWWLLQWLQPMRRAA